MAVTYLELKDSVVKIDLELVRKIALVLEEHYSNIAPRPLVVDGYTQDEVDAHAYYMLKAGLVLGAETTHLRSEYRTASISGLTVDGQHFAVHCRTDTAWKAASEAIKEKGIAGATLGMFNKMLTKQINKLLDDPPLSGK